MSEDLEKKLDLLRIFNREGIEKIKSQPIPQFFESLTSLAECVVRESHKIALQELLKTSPVPCGDFSVVAMGKFGGREITYRSDLDVIYIFENAESQEFYSRLGQRIISYITLPTSEGYAYKMDAELRPSGNAGTLVSTLDAFIEYHHHSGQTWERQALIKARPIEGIGKPDFLKRLQQTFEDISYQDVSPAKVANEIYTMRKRIENELAREKPGLYNLKTGRGGIVDVEFIAQYLQLVHGKKHPQIRTQNTIQALRTLAAESLLDAISAKPLEEAYFFYRTLETNLRMTSEWATDRLVSGHPALEEFLKKREEVRAIFEKVFGKNPS